MTTIHPHPNLDEESNNETVLQIGVTDDEINEAMEQNFVVIINVTGTINNEGTRVTRPSSICRIIDNDRKIDQPFSNANTQRLNQEI